MLQANMRQAGLPVQQCACISGLPTLCTLVTSPGAPAGANQAAATKIPSDLVILTGTATGSGTGYLLPPGVDAAVPGPCTIGDMFTVINQGGNAVLVYPNSATGKIQGAGAGVGFSVANNKQANFIYLGGDLWAADLSA